VNLALFAADTDQEIVVDTATGGRTTYRNAARRAGAVRGGVGRRPRRRLHRARQLFVPQGHVRRQLLHGPAAGRGARGRAPAGVPPQQAYGVLAWTPGGFYGFGARLEAQYVGRVYANDRNTAYAPSYTIGNARVSFAQSSGKRARERVRAAQQHATTSIHRLGDRGRHERPLLRACAGRNWFAGVTLDVALLNATPHGDRAALDHRASR
jgi:iron complex outermembrane receptor protein